MSFPELFALAVALAMDAFAVSVCSGCALKRVTTAHFLRLSLTFGFFQFLMPVIGWTLGLTVRGFIETWDHWLAFALLAWIGGNMLRDAFGIVAMVAMTPLVTIQSLGAVFKLKTILAAPIAMADEELEIIEL